MPLRRRTKLLVEGHLPVAPNHDQVQRLLGLWADTVLAPQAGDARTSNGSYFDDIEVGVGRRTVALGDLDGWLERHMETASPEMLDVVAAASPVAFDAEIQRSFAPALLAAEAALVLARSVDPTLQHVAPHHLIARSDHLHWGAQWLLRLASVRQANAVARLADEPRSSTQAGMITVSERPRRLVRADGYPVAMLHREVFQELRGRALKVPGSVVHYPAADYTVEVLAYDAEADTVRIQPKSGNKLLPVEEADREELQRTMSRSDAGWEYQPSAMMRWSVQLGRVDVQLPPSPRRIGRPGDHRGLGHGGSLA